MKLLKAKTIFTADGDAIVRDGAVLVNDRGKIEAVGRVGQMPDCAGAQVIDYGDATLLPGLMDLHVHLAYWQAKDDNMIYEDSPGLVALLAMHELKTCFPQGVTTIRTVTDPCPGIPYAVKTGLAKGFIDGPRYISCNNGITVTGGHASVMRGGMVVEADGPDAFRKAVRRQIKEGADWIKLMTSHQHIYCELTQAEMSAAADEAHSWDKKICAHVASEKSVEYAINAGIDTLEHGIFMTVSQAQRARDKGIAWVPTIYAVKSYYDVVQQMIAIPPEERPLSVQDYLDVEAVFFLESEKRFREHFAQVAATGIKIAAGTDAVFGHQPLLTPVYEEILLLKEHGVADHEAIRAATSNAAEILGLENETGRVKEGLAADLLVVDGDLTADLENIRNIAAVYYGGRLVHNKS